MPTERSVLARLKLDPSDWNRGIVSARAALRGLRDDIDTTNDRTAWLAQGILALGPSLVPLGAAATPVLSGIITQLTVAGTAAVTTGLAFNGIGDALKAVNDYQLEPTTANLLKMGQALDKIGPAGQEFVQFLDKIGPEFSALQDTAREGLFPGVEAGIREFMDLLPQVDRITRETAEGLGLLTTEAGQGLAGPRFAEFFAFMETEAKPILLDMGRTFGNFADGLAQMIVEFGPLTSDFSGGLLNMSRDFAEWAHTLDGNRSFQEFLDYVQETGPKALDFFGSLIDALAAIVAAAAPVGDVMLPVFTKFLDIISALADTPLGPAFITAAAFMSLYGRAAALASITTGGLTARIVQNTAAMQAWNSRSQGGLATMRLLPAAMANVAGGIGLLVTQMTDIDDKAGLANTAMLGMAGLMVGGPWGAAIGTGIGLVKDFSESYIDMGEAIGRTNEVLASGSEQELERYIASLRSQIEEIADLSGGKEIFGAVVDEIQSFGGLLGDNTVDRQRAAIQELQSKISDAQDAILGLNGNSRDLSDQIAPVLAQSLGLAAGQAEELADGIQEVTAELAQLDRVLSKRSALRGFEAAIDAVNEAVKENGRTLDRNTDKGRANQEVLDGIASNAGKVAEKLKGMDRVDFLVRAREQLIEAAKSFGRTDKQAEAFVNRLKIFRDLVAEGAEGKVDLDDTDASRKLVRLMERARLFDGLEIEPGVTADTAEAERRLRETEALLKKLGITNVTPRVLADVSDAMAGINAVKTGLNSIDPVKNIDIYVNYRKTGSTGADGATVPKTGLPYADRHPYLLADGEEVVSNRYGGADRNRYELKAASRGARLRVVGMADGGTAGGDADTGDDPLGTKRLSRHLRELIKTIRADIEERKARLAELKSQRSSLVSSVRDRFRESPFTLDGSIWVSGAGNIRRSLREDIGDARAMTRAERELRAKGFGGAAFADLAQNADLATIQAMADLGRKKLAEIERLYGVRAQASGRAGRLAGDIGYGAQMARVENELKGLRKDLKGAVPKKIGDEVGSKIKRPVSRAGRRG